MMIGIPVLILALLAFYWMYFRNDVYLWKVERMSLFLTDDSFFSEKMSVAGGFLHYLGCFFTQLFHFQFWGSVLYAVMIAGLSMLIIWSFGLGTKYAGLAVIPASAVLLTCTELGYMLYVVKLPGYFYAALLGTLFISLFFGLYVRVRRCAGKVSYASSLVMLVLFAFFYAFIGTYAVALLVCCAVYELVAYRLKGIVSKIAPKDMGVIIRTAAEGASEEAIVKDLETLVHQWERITAKRDEFLHGKRPKLLQGEPDVAIRVVRDIFNDDFDKMIVEGDKVYARIEEYLDTMAPDLKDKLEKWDPAEHEGKDVFDKWQIDSQLRKGMERQVYLPSGGSIVIDRTEAMTTIDVNTGRFIGRGKSLEETVTRCNLEASEEIARQLRLRDIGGMVMIDYVDMVMPANRDLVLRRLVECLARDRTKHQVAEVTSLGLVQMTRKRIGQGLVEAFSEECPTCKGRGFILHDEPTVSADFDDPYALKGGDPFVKTNKHGQGTQVQMPQGSSPDVKAKLAQIAAAAVAASTEE